MVFSFFYKCQKNLHSSVHWPCLKLIGEWGHSRCNVLYSAMSSAPAFFYFWNDISISWWWLHSGQGRKSDWLIDQSSEVSFVTVTFTGDRHFCSVEETLVCERHLQRFASITASHEETRPGSSHTSRKEKKGPAHILHNMQSLNPCCANTASVNNSSSLSHISTRTHTHTPQQISVSAARPVWDRTPTGPRRRCR